MVSSKMYLASRWNRIPDSIAFDGSVVTKTMQIPPGYYRALKICPQYKVTDAGISAGENWEGMLGSFKIETPEDGEVFYCETDELSEVCKFLNDMAPVAGLCMDSLPTTAEDQDVSYTLNGPWAFPSGALVTITKKAYTDEFASATAYAENFFMATCSMDSIPRVARMLKRVASSSATVHNLDTGRQALTKVLTVCATDVFKRMTVTGNGATYVDSTVRSMLKGIYALHVQSDTEATGKYLLTEVNAPYSVDRKAVIELSSAAAITVYFENLKRIA